MISNETRQKITDIWDSYVENHRIVLDTKGRKINNINELRLKAIADIKSMILQFTTGFIDLREFKTAIDGYNKRNNLWGFTATKGQMFFNQLVKANDPELRELAALISNSIAEPTDLDHGLETISEFEGYVRAISSKAPDKRKAPNPGSVGYFLSYFWQIHDHTRWPLMYTSLTRAFGELGVWSPPASQRDAYRCFFEINEEIKDVLRVHSKQPIGNWDAEHAFWNYNGDTLSATPSVPKNDRQIPIAEQIIDTEVIEINANFALSDYLIPKVSRLVELGNETERQKQASTKGSWRRSSAY